MCFFKQEQPNVDDGYLQYARIMISVCVITAIAYVSPGDDTLQQHTVLQAMLGVWLCVLFILTLKETWRFLCVLVFCLIVCLFVSAMIFLCWVVTLTNAAVLSVMWYAYRRQTVLFWLACVCLCLNFIGFLYVKIRPIVVSCIAPARVNKRVSKRRK